MSSHVVKKKRAASVLLRRFFYTSLVLTCGSASLNPFLVVVRPKRREKSLPRTGDWSEEMQRVMRLCADLPFFARTPADPLCLCVCVSLTGPHDEPAASPAQAQVQRTLTP